MTDRGTYIKMSDSLPEHRKIVAVGGDAGWLHICALAYCSRNLTDGFIPQDFVPRLSDRRQPMRLAARLVDKDLWHAPGHDCKKCPQPPPGEYVIHDYLEHQRSAARVAEVSEKRSVSGAKGGSKSKPKPKQVASGLLDDCLLDAEANEKPSFTEGVLRTPQTEAEVPTTSDAAKPRREPPSELNVGHIVAAFVDGATEAGLDTPGASIKARVGRDARQLLKERKPIEALIESARRMGAGKYDDLAKQYRMDDAAAKGVTQKDNGRGRYAPGTRPSDPIPDDYTSAEINI